MFEQLLKWDRDLLLYLNNLGSPSFDSFWFAVTNFWNWILLFILLIFFMVRENSKKEALYRLLTFSSMLILLALIIFFTKEAVGRLRPCNDSEINSLIRVVLIATDYSFFSGHASTSFSIATLTVLFLRKKIKWIYIIYIWAILFSYSRIYLGLHYPIDIMVGVLIGVVFGVFFYKMFCKFQG